MAPPEAPMDGTARQGNNPPAVSVCPEVLEKRADFLLAARARRQGTKGMMVQARKRSPDEPARGTRVGFTCSKKVGNAVARNRAKRRLREVARLILPEYGQAGWDYVLIGRAEVTATRPFPDLQGDLIYALKKLHQT
ncbi:ribonuclease P protein component [Thalassovita litoralis]|nr:ribonuclease P protein component [Thalassovita litoralis]